MTRVCGGGVRADSRRGGPVVLWRAAQFGLVEEAVNPPCKGDGQTAGSSLAREGGKCLSP